MATSKGAGNVAALRDILDATDPKYGLKWDSSTDDTGAWINLLAAANGKAIQLPGDSSLNSVVSASLTLPRSVRIFGQTRRSVANPPSAIGSAILAAFAGPVFTYAPGVLTSADILLEGFGIRGQKATYGAGNGITITNAADVTIKRMVISNFGTNNIATNGNTITIENVYSATAGNANFYIDSSMTKVRNCQADNGVYGLQSTVNGTDLSIDGGTWLEGASAAGMRIAGQRTVIDQAAVNMTLGGKGLLLDASTPRLHLGTGFKALGDGTGASTIGIDLGSNLEYTLMGVLSSNFASACRFSEGAGTIIGGQLEGTVTGLDATGGSFWTQVLGVYISGPTNSILHNSGDRVQYIGCRLDNGSGTYQAPTISAGSPLFFIPNATELFARGVLDLSVSSARLGGGGGTGLVSVGAADSAGVGFRQVRIPN